MDKLKELVISYKLPVALTLIGVVLLGGGIISSFSRITTPSNQTLNLPKSSLISSEKVSKSVTVDVSGAVKNPGVYHLETDSRVEDALKAAGGFTVGVNKAFVVKQLNLASKLADGVKIYIPFEGESAPTPVIGATTTSSSAQTSSKVNLNSASQTEIESLPGIGAVTAAKIMTLRPYASPGELLSKKAVSKSVYDKVKDMVEI